MNAFKRIAAGLAATLVPLVSSAQYVDHDAVKCEPVPKAEMRGQMELQRELTGKGWRVRQVKSFNGCYEVYGFDESGRRVEAFFNPKTFQKVGEVKHE